jgi:hypothetical protein
VFPRGSNVSVRATPTGLSTDRILFGQLADPLSVVSQTEKSTTTELQAVLAVLARTCLVPVNGDSNSYEAQPNENYPT